MDCLENSSKNQKNGHQIMSSGPLEYSGPQVSSVSSIPLVSQTILKQPSFQDSKDSVIIVGAGFAGLSAALTLAQAGEKVTLLEASQFAGGRARAVPFEESYVDNGQHILLGGYQNTLSLLNLLKLPLNALFFRSPLKLILHGLPNFFNLSLPPLKAPYHLLAGLFLAKGLTTLDRIKILQCCYQLKKNNFELLEDISVKDWVSVSQQTPLLIEKLWKPLTMAALSTPIEEASAQILLNILKDIFTEHEHYSHILIPKVNLTDLFAKPALQYLQERGHSINFRQRVLNLEFSEEKCIGVRTQSNFFKSKAVIIATPPFAADSLLSGHSKLLPIQKQCQLFSYQPITTVYLKIREKLNLPFPMTGFTSGLSQWIFDRSFVDASNNHSNPANIASIVITGVGRHSHLSKKELIQQITFEVQSLIESRVTVIASQVITEKRAVFSCVPHIQKIRPSVSTPIQNLYLAGDYTKTNYPATLEGAVQSGIEAATLLLSKNSV